MNSFVEKNKELSLVKLAWKELNKQLRAEILKFKRSGYDRGVRGTFLLGVKQAIIIKILIEGWKSETEGILNVKTNHETLTSSIEIYGISTMFSSSPDKIELVVDLHDEIDNCIYISAHTEGGLKTDIAILEELLALEPGDYKTYKVQ